MPILPLARLKKIATSSLGVVDKLRHRENAQRSVDLLQAQYERVLGILNQRTTHTTYTGPTSGTNYTDLLNERTSAYNRKAIVEHAVQMYHEDDRVSQCVDGIAEDASQVDGNQEPFRIEFLESDVYSEKEQQELVKRLTHMLHQERVALPERACDIQSDILLTGTEFFETVVDFDKKEVVGVVQVPNIPTGHVVIRVETVPSVVEYSQARTYDPNVGATKRRQLLGYAQMDTNLSSVYAVFAPWQVTQVNWNMVSGNRYGLPLFASAWKNWTRLDRMERDLIVARALRSFIKLIFHYPDATDEQIERTIKAQEKHRLTNADGVLSDVYTNAADVTVVDPENAQLHNLDDVQYAEDKLVASGRRPRALYGSGGAEVNRATLEFQVSNYYKGLLHQVNQRFAGLVKRQCVMQLLLWGYNPVWLPLRVRFTRRVVESQMAQAQRAAILTSIGVSKHQTFLELGIDYAENRRQLLREAKEQAELDRIALAHTPDIADLVNRVKKPLGSVSQEG
jgi:hypothetical protein